jgi:GNAT superfamily N-acetyltransferase
LVVPYVASTLVNRLDRDWIWMVLSTDAYWARWRTRADVEAQIEGAWRIVGVYDSASGAQVGYARAVSDGVADAYLADVIADPAHRGGGVGKLILNTMIDDGPGSEFRWTLFTRDAHGLYAQYGFATPDDTTMVRPSRRTAQR